ncbi:hypothetical protein [Frigidibacter sp. MR17.24]|uniref:hypothetical protein n=1 Tax=Frigidibacter sp. MR17.24 TaxID=3127345 RepID=UPI003012A5B9
MNFKCFRRNAASHLAARILHDPRTLRDGLAQILLQGGETTKTFLMCRVLFA